MCSLQLTHFEIRAFFFSQLFSRALVLRFSACTKKVLPVFNSGVNYHFYDIIIGNDKKGVFEHKMAISNGYC